MKLLYLWKPKYGHLQFVGGITFSPEYQFEFSRETCNLIITSKPYIYNFYGSNISEVTAIVGANGSGKTTVALDICQYCQGVKAIVDTNAISDEEFVQVYEEHNEIWIYYYLSGDSLEDNQWNINVAKCYDVSRLNEGIYGVNFDEESKQHNLTSVYITNIFVPEDMTFRSKMPSLAVGDTNFCIAYSPANCLKIAKNRFRDGYGASTNGLYGLIWSNISEYEKRMSDYDVFIDYENYCGELFIRCYKNAPDEVIAVLPIFQKYILGVHQFGSYINQKKWKGGMLDDFDNSVIEIISKIKYFDIVNQSIFKQCFINVLCEADLHFGFIKLDTGTERSKVGKEIDKYWEKTECIIDVNLLRTIKDSIVNLENPKNDFTNTSWLIQLQNSIEIFEKYKDDEFKTAQNEAAILQNFGDNDYILDFFLSECEKDFSYFHRYFIFMPLPSSAGELALVNIFAYLNNALTQKNADNVILIIDEIDAMLHPTWQQMILKSLVGYIEKRYANKQFQIVFTTHSPIILSDMTSDRVVKLKNDSGVVAVHKCEETILGSNIEKLFYDDFFMDKGSIGEIAKDKIEKVLGYINRETEISKNEVDYIINSIGEPFVQRNLRKKVDEMYSLTTIEKLRQKIQEIGPEKALDIISENF